MSSKASRAVRRIRLRYARRHDFRPASEPLEIARLISPVRYDVLVRASYFTFLAKHLDLFHEDFEAYTRLAMCHPYYDWFRLVPHPRFIRGDDLHQAYQRRLRKATELYLSFEERGFDTQFPILVLSAGPVATTPTGKVLAGRQFPFDGCHRLALLHLAGHRTLGPESYRVRTDPRWSPPDNTHALIGALGIQPPEYYGFLSLGYVTGSSRFEDEASLLAHLRANNQAALNEVENVLAVDRPVLAPTGGQLPRLASNRRS